MMAFDQNGRQKWHKTIKDKRTTDQGKVTRVQLFLDGNDLVLVASVTNDRQVSTIDKSTGSTTSELVVAGVGFAQDSLSASSTNDGV